MSAFLVLALLVEMIQKRSIEKVKAKKSGPPSTEPAAPEGFADEDGYVKQRTVSPGQLEDLILGKSAKH